VEAFFNFTKAWSRQDSDLSLGTARSSFAAILLPSTPTTTTTTEAPTVTGTTVVLITGGYDNGALSGTEIYPTGCSLPDLPSVRYGHTTFATTGPSTKIVTCGGNTGSYTASCLVLDVENQQWEENVVGKLPAHRRHAASVGIENVGTYLIGGICCHVSKTTDFLPAGSTEWAAGPAIPVDMDQPCAVVISQLSFLIINKNNIREYQVDISNPTSNSGWQSASKFPQLLTRRTYQPGCSKIGDQVVIGGGFNFQSEWLRSTEVLNLSTRTITYAGDLNSARAYFHMATLTINGQQTLLAFGGQPEPSNLNSVEQFHTHNNTWTLASTTMEKARSEYGAVVVPRELVCPT